jgi:ubiquinone/menaquinone biosynthesis C-methylase UbiE
VSDEPDYILGFDESEQRRLALQDQLFRGFTRALLCDAGIAPGMHVLDVGSGVGDVSMLAAECVGPTGSVLGVEQSPAYVAAARRRAAARNLTNLEFIEGDLFEVVPERSFDLVVGRFVLEWLPDPIRAVRHLATRVRPGGALVFQDYDHPLHEGQYSFPVAPYFERVLDACIDALAKHGLNRRMGAMLRQTFMAAQLPAPSLRVDVAMGGGPDYPAYTWLAAGACSLRRALAASPIAADVDDLDSLADRIRADACARDSVVRLAPIVGAWVRC